MIANVFSNSVKALGTDYPTLSLRLFLIGREIGKYMEPSLPSRTCIQRKSVSRSSNLK